MCIYYPLVASLQHVTTGNASGGQIRGSKIIRRDTSLLIMKAGVGGVKKEKPKEKATQFIKLQFKKKTKQLKSKKLKQLGVSDIATESTTPVLA